MFGFMQTMGGFESPRFWCYAFIYISILKKARIQIIVDRNKHKTDSIIRPIKGLHTAFLIGKSI